MQTAVLSQGCTAMLKDIQSQNTVLHYACVKAAEADRSPFRLIIPPGVLQCDTATAQKRI